MFDLPFRHLGEDLAEVAPFGFVPALHISLEVCVGTRGTVVKHLHLLAELLNTQNYIHVHCCCYLGNQRKTPFFLSLVLLSHARKEKKCAAHARWY